MSDEIVVRIRAEGQQQFIKDMKKAGVTVEQTGDKVDESNKKMGKSFAGLGKVIGGAFAVATIIQFTKVLAKAAVDIDATNKKIQTVFGESTKAVEDFAKQNATSLGLTVNEYKRAAAAVGDLLIPIGFQRKEAAALSNDLVQLSGALSAWTGGQLNASEVSQILTKALLGEREQLKQLGIQISEADVKARLLEKGQKNLTGATLAQAKATATLELITEKSADAQAAFGDDTKTLAEQQLELSANVRELRDNLAEQFIPVLTDVITALNNGVKAWNRFNDAISGRGEQAEFEAGLEILDQYALKVERLTLVLRKSTVEQENNILATKELKEINAKIAAIDKEIASRERRTDTGDDIIENEVRSLALLKDQLKEQQKIVNTAEAYSQEQIEANNNAKALKAEIKEIEDSLKGVSSQTGFALLKDQIGEAQKAIDSIDPTLDPNGFNVAVQQLQALIDKLEDLNQAAKDAVIGENIAAALDSAVAIISDAEIDVGELITIDPKIVQDGIDANNEARQEGREADAAAELKLAQETAAKRRDIAATSLNAIGSFANEISNFRTALAERELQALQEKLDQGLISEKQFEKEKAEIQRKQAQQQKANAIFTAIVNGAAGVVSQFQAGPAGIALAAIVAALTAAQIAVIAAQPIPQFAKGTKYVDGKGYPDGVDTVPAYLSKGERVITADKNKKYWDALNAIHADRPDKLITAIAQMGIPVQFKSTYEELYKPMSAISEISDTANELGIDFKPLINTSERQRLSLGKKLDKIHMALISQQGHRMTKA